MDKFRARRRAAELKGVTRLEGFPTPSNGAGSALSLAGMSAEALAKAGGKVEAGPRKK